MDKIYKTTVAMKLDVRKQSTVTSERWEINKMSPADSPNYCLEKMSHVQGRVEGNQAESRSLHELK